ncbi:MAG: hypothetical protein JWP74_2167 [Marmoricola sp.]|nr:hypothetical protein [Marmoricola sp.]
MSSAPAPVRDKLVWVFNCADAFIGNPKWLFLYITKFRPDIEAVWLTNTESTVAQIRKLGYRAETFKSRKGIAVQRRAGVWVVNQVKEQIPANLTGVVLLNLWHGVGVKSIERGMNEGYLRERIARKYIRNNQAYHDTQLFLVTSPEMEKHFTKYIGLSEDRVIRGGYPQNVYTRLHGEVSTFDHDLLRRKGLPAGTRVAIYSPTPRRTSNKEFLNQALPDIPRLLETLRRENILLILKMHPHLTSDATFSKLREAYGHEPNLMFWDNTEDVYEVFHQIDIAVVDYSSILYDMLDAGVTKVVRYIFDYHDGNAVLEPGVDYLGLSCGAVAADFDQLLERLGEDLTVAAEDLAPLNDYFWAYSDDKTFDTIVDKALSFEPKQTPLPTLYSYDVFDTLIHRKVVEPRGIFYAVMQQMQESSIHFPGFLEDRFPELREQAESNVRENRRKRPELRASGDLEITLADIYDRLADLYDLTAEQRALLMQWEQDVEISNVLPNVDRIAEVKELLDAGETVVLLSDMYLPKSTLTTMLAAADPALATVPLYLSNEHKAQKSTRRLYLTVYEDLGYDFAGWQHVGDNRLADIRSARQLGIQARKVRKPSLGRYGLNLVSSLHSYDGFLVAGMMQRFKEPEPEAQFAYRYASLYLVPYVDWVLDDAVKRNYKTLYFISRDGHFMKPIADALIAERGLDLRTKYIYGSRKSWRLASQIDGIDEDTFTIYGTFAGARSVTALAEAARMSVEDLLTMFPSMRKARNGRFSAEELTAYLAEMQASTAFREYLAGNAVADRDLAVRYFQQEIDFDEPFSVVEYWGRGYTQDCMVRLVAKAAGRELAVPFYYARSIYLSEGLSVRHNFTSGSYSLLLIESIFANLPYGTVEGYRLDGDTVVPVTSPREHDETLKAALEVHLPTFARDFGREAFLDRSRVRRELFRYGFEDFKENEADPVYVNRVGHLRDAVSLSGDEREFAPALTPRLYVDYVRGTPLTSITRSVTISIRRSTGMGKYLFLVHRKFALPVRTTPPGHKRRPNTKRWQRDRNP